MNYKPETKKPEWNCNKCGELFIRTPSGIRQSLYMCPSCKTSLKRRKTSDRVRSVFEFRGSIELGSRA